MATAIGMVNKADYERWAKEVLTPEKYAEVVKQYGEAPGEYMSGVKNGEPALAFSCLRFGNVVLMPQPVAAAGDNEFQIYTGLCGSSPCLYCTLFVDTEGFSGGCFNHFGTAWQFGIYSRKTSGFVIRGLAGPINRDCSSFLLLHDR